MAFLRAATQDRGANVDAATYLRQWVSENPSFEDVVSMDYWLPMIPPIREDESQNDGQRRFYRMMKSIVTVRTIYLEESGGEAGAFLSSDLPFFQQGFISSGRPMLLGSGLPEDIVNQMEANVLKEMAEARIPQYTRVQRVYARKKSN